MKRCKASESENTQYGRLFDRQLVHAHASRARSRTHTRTHVRLQYVHQRNLRRDNMALIRIIARDLQHHPPVYPFQGYTLHVYVTDGGRSFRAHRAVLPRYRAPAVRCYCMVGGPCGSLVDRKVTGIQRCRKRADEVNDINSSRTMSMINKLLSHWDAFRKCTAVAPTSVQRIVYEWQSMEVVESHL